MSEQPSEIRINRERLFSLFTASPTFSDDGGLPNPDEPHKPGPWDPVIRVAARDLARVSFGSPLASWHAAMGSLSLLQVIARRFPAIGDVIGGGGILDEVALNPQPLPPVEMFIDAIGEALVSRAELLGDVARATGGQGSDAEDRGIIIVSGFVDRLVDEWCATGFHLRWPIPGPRPNWFRAKVTPRDTLALGTRLYQASRETADPSVSRALAGAANKLADAAVRGG